MVLTYVESDSTRLFLVLPLTVAQKADLPLLCERYATSKLAAFEDLQALATYGFRGEALASISYCSHLEVVTKTRADACGWK
jgi:DNA mismatch repair protein MLH1